MVGISYDISNLVERLVGYLLPLISSGQLKPGASPEMRISHMGAIITDAIFQAGMRYTTVEDWREWVCSQEPAETVSGFLELLGDDARTFYSMRRKKGAAWGRKAELVKKVATIFVDDKVVTKDDLRAWLQKPEKH